MPTSPWSPDGKHLVLFRISEGRFTFAVWNVETGRTLALPGLPDSVWAPFTWLNDKLVYAVLGEGNKQETSNVQGLALVERRWREVWAGRAAHVTVSSTSPVFESSTPPPGSLMLADLRTGSTTKLASGDYLALAPSPDGLGLAAVRLDEAIPSAYHFKGRRGELQLFQTGPRGAVLRRRLAALDVDENLAWAPSGRSLLFAGKPKDALKADSRLYVADFEGEGLREIAASGLSFVVPDLNSYGASLPLGWIDGAPAGIALAPPAQAGTASASRRRHLYSFARGEPRNLTASLTGGTGAFIPTADKQAALVVADGGLWRVSPTSPPVPLFGSALQRVNGFFVVNRYPALPASDAYSAEGARERVALVVTESNVRRRVVLDLATKTLESLPGENEAVAVSRDLRTGVVRKTSGWRSALSFADEPEREFAATNAHLKAKAVIAPRQFTYSVGGTPFKAWVVDPRGGRSPGPAVVSVYGGTVRGDNPPSEAGATLPPPPNALPVLSAQLLAAQGYAVVYPSLPVEPGTTSDIPAAFAEHAAAAVDSLAAEGVVDPARVGLIGHSFGGYTVASILTKRSDRFKAGVALAGMYDPVHGYGVRSFIDGARLDGREQALSIPYMEASQLQLEAPPWKALDAYARNSPFLQVESINAPLLMLHGDLDRSNVDIAGADRMHSALLRAGKTTALVRYWGEGHVAAARESIRDQWARITAWFGHYLLDRPVRAPSPSSPPTGEN